eukprot:360762-Chlamydomonas_euryale.AAC.3
MASCPPRHGCRSLPHMLPLPQAAALARYCGGMRSTVDLPRWWLRAAATAAAIAASASRPAASVSASRIATESRAKLTRMPCRRGSNARLMHENHACFLRFRLSGVWGTGRWTKRLLPSAGATAQ